MLFIPSAHGRIWKQNQNTIFKFVNDLQFLRQINDCRFGGTYIIGALFLLLAAGVEIICTKKKWKRQSEKLCNDVGF